MTDNNVSKNSACGCSGCPCRRSRYGFAAFLFFTLLAAWLLLRVVLFAQFGHDKPVPTGDLIKALLHGFHRDILVGLLCCLPMTFWFAVVPNRVFGKKWHRIFFLSTITLFWLAEIFQVFSEYFFFEEFLSRFNTVAVDYLIYPHEVFINIWDTYPVVWVIIGCTLVASAWVFAANRFFAGMWSDTPSPRMRWSILGLLVGASVLLSLTISLKGPRFSKERVINEIANNGSISFVAAAWTHQLDYTAFYKTMPLDQAYQRVRGLLQEPGAEFVGQGNDIRRRMQGDPNRPKLNVVIILEESFGSEFWGTLSRTNGTLTPEMDKLATSEGLFFTNMYASGNRTVRGIEGVISSFPPLPGEAIVKRDLSDNVESLARVLKRDGYTNIFMYGGRGVFDGVRKYAMPNGYDRFVEQKHFENPAFATIWGVCNEDLFNKSIQECREMAKSGKPFFATMLTVSNHKPFTYPKNRIPENPDDRTRENVVKYTDFALGQYFRDVKKESFWTNTVFVVIADHGARVYGSQTIPIHSYEIPLVILGPAVVKTPARIGTLGCSLDVSPTVLGLIGRPYESMFFGHDLLKIKPEAGRVTLNHNRSVGLYAAEHMTILGLRGTVEHYEGDPKAVDMKPVSKTGPQDIENEKDCVALFQVADDLYMHRRYKIDNK